MLLCKVDIRTMMMLMFSWRVTLDLDGFDFSDAYNDPFSSDHGFDIDLPLSTINVFAAQQRGRPPNNPDPTIRLPDSIFSKAESG